MATAEQCPENIYILGQYEKRACSFSCCALKHADVARLMNVKIEGKGESRWILYDLQISCWAKVCIKARTMFRLGYKNNIGNKMIMNIVYVWNYSLVSNST